MLKEVLAKEEKLRISAQETGMEIHVMRQTLKKEKTSGGQPENLHQ